MFAKVKLQCKLYDYQFTIPSYIRSFLMTYLILFILVNIKVLSYLE